MVIKYNFKGNIFNSYNFLGYGDVNMKKIFCCLFIFLGIIFCTNKYYVFAMKETEDNDELKKNLFSLIKGYSDYISSIEKNEKGEIFIITKNNTRIIYDDLKDKSVNEKFINPDLQDLFFESYPLQPIRKVMELNKDPGRLRNYKLLNNVYGSSKSEIEKNLTTINTKYGNIIFNKCNNAAENLKKALDEVWIASCDEAKINDFVMPISGTYNYRVIQDTGMLSPHSYGIAIDLNRNDADYWKWVPREKGDSRIAIYPKVIVESFEKYGFVWGGKWSHFDILHFEYKPEIIIKAKYFFEDDKNEVWDYNIPKDDKNIEIINLINEKIN